MERIDKNKQEGFALIEVMIAAVVFSIAAIGFMKLQSRALSESYENYASQQAQTIITDFIEKIRADRSFRANQTFIAGGILAMANNSSTPCTGDICQSGVFSYQAREIATAMGTAFPMNLSALCYIADVGTDQNNIRVDFIWRGKNNANPNNNLISDLTICPPNYNGGNPNLTDADRAVTVYARI